MALNIYLIRHGKTVWNQEGRLQGSADTVLAEEGIQGAKQVGEALKDVNFTVCYSSMLKRAQDTANYILGGKDVPHFHHKGLNEIDFGSWEGTKSADLTENEEYWQMKQCPAEYKALSNGGETVEQLYQRVTKVFDQIVALHQNAPGETNILLVAHGMTLTLLTAVLKGVHWHDFRNPEKHSFVMNTAINRVQVENGKVVLVEFNRTDHLA